MLEINNLTIEVNFKVIINNLNLVINRNDKLAIIGEEGNGKSTLLKAILGINEYAKVNGNINLRGNRLGYLAQSLSEIDIEKSVFDFLFKNQEDYYNKISSLYNYLSDLSIDENILERKKLKYLSGGEKVKIQLLKILLEEADILLLDEPTNDLDIETLNWLEKFIINIDKPVIFVSHDETLLSRTANMILHLELVKHKEECRHTVIKTDYDNYVSSRIRQIDRTNQFARKEEGEHKRKEKKLKQIMQKVEYRQETITRADPAGGRLLKKKMKTLKHQQRKLDNENITSYFDSEESINIFFRKSNIHNNKVVLDLKLDKLEVENRVLSQNIKLEVIGASKIAIIGTNGVGKSTLITYIYNIVKERTDLKIGYMAQNYDDLLLEYSSSISFLTNSTNKKEIGLIRSYLGNMNFTCEEMICDIKRLSGGSKAKLILVKLMLDDCDVLILDEPTRNVSPLSNPIIRKALKEFNGAIISISHDRKYINEVCDKVYELSREGINEIKDKVI